MPHCRAVSLAQVLIKLTAPGIPDFYQGTELWAHALVDPDNRRPVDFAHRAELLAELEGMSSGEALLHADGGLPKLWMTHRVLRMREKHAHAFSPAGSYAPVSALGPDAEGVFAFLRAGEVLTAVPRLAMRRAWVDTTLPLPPGRWCNELGGVEFVGAAPIADLFSRFPVAFLIRQ